MGVGDGQGGLACCNPWGCKGRHDWATALKWTDIHQEGYTFFSSANIYVPMSSSLKDTTKNCLKIPMKKTLWPIYFTSESYQIFKEESMSKPCKYFCKLEDKRRFLSHLIRLTLSCYENQKNILNQLSKNNPCKQR